MGLKEVGTTTQGHTIYVEEGEQGPRYVSDEIGGGCVIWEPAIAAPESLEVAIKHWREQQG